MSPRECATYNHNIQPGEQITFYAGQRTPLPKLGDPVTIQDFGTGQTYTGKVVEVFSNRFEFSAQVNNF